MRTQRIAAGLVLAVLVGALPLTAAEPVAAPAAASTVTVQASQPDAAKPALPADLSGLFTPEPTNRLGYKDGPCVVSVTCTNGQLISCGGLVSCLWLYDSTPGTGFVQCDGWRITCTRGGGNN